MRIRQKRYRIGTRGQMMAIDFAFATRCARLYSITKLDNNILTGADAEAIWKELPDMVSCDLYRLNNMSKLKFNIEARQWFLKYASMSGTQ